MGDNGHPRQLMNNLYKLPTIAIEAGSTSSYDISFDDKLYYGEKMMLDSLELVLK